MSRRKPSADTDAELSVIAAKAQAKARGISALEAFTNVVKGIPRVTTAHRSRMFDFDDLTTPAMQLDAAHRDGRLHTLRLDLEAALLRLDACCSPALGREGDWPTEGELEALRKLVFDTAVLIGKRIPVSFWKRGQRLDHYFPKLRLCKRVASFVTRIAGSLPPRPMAALLPAPGTKMNDLLKQFFIQAGECRKGSRDPATVEWVEFVSLLLRYQNAERKRLRKAPWPMLRQRPGAPTGWPAIEAYVAFLELDRADLLWVSRNWKKLWPVLAWVNTLGNAALMGKLASFWPGSVNMAESVVKGFEELEAALKRESAKDRKAKSRKKLGKKV